MQTEVYFNRSINKENKYWGLSLVGLISGAAFGVIILTVFDFLFAAIGSIAGFTIGSFISYQWHKGKLQRWIYWNLPVSYLSRNRYLPPSSSRRFM